MPERGLLVERERVTLVDQIRLAVVAALRDLPRDVDLVLRRARFKRIGLEALIDHVHRHRLMDTFRGRREHLATLACCRDNRHYTTPFMRALKSPIHLSNSFDSHAWHSNPFKSGAWP